MSTDSRSKHARDIAGGARSTPLTLVRGLGSFVADLQLDGCLEAAFARSWEAHGKVARVDVTRAREVPGVVGAFAASDLPDLPDTPAPPVNPVDPVFARPPLTRDRVRHVGEPMAVVVARDRYLAEDAVEHVEIEIDPLPHVLDPTSAALPDAPRLFDGTSNVVTEQVWGTRQDEMQAILDAAPVVVELSIRNERLAPAPMEGRAIAAVPHPQGGLTVYCSHQAPHQLRNALCAAFNLDRSDVRVIVPDVGGAFGQKSHTFPEYLAVVHLARLLGRPIRWVEDRRESFISSTHGRGQSQRVRLASDRDGNVLALEVRIDADIGAYPHTGGAVPLFSALVQSGPYRFPYVSVVCRAMVTNSVPTAPYRGAGRPEAAFAIEVTMDRLAAELGIDPADLRFRNFVDRDSFPYLSPTGATYDSGDYAEALRLALDLADYEGFRRRQRDAKERGRLLGIGISSFIERSGGHAGGEEFAEIEIRAEGDVLVMCGSTATGQNHHDALAKIAASVLGIDAGRIVVIEGDTKLVREGVGTFASRSMQVGGSAVMLATEEVLRSASQAAGRLLEVAEQDLVYQGGAFSVVGAPDRTVSLEQIASEVGQLTASHRFASPQAFPYGSYVAAVEIDPETYDVKVLQLTAVDDCGRIIDPDSFQGQVTGSIAQGVGQALYERIVYDEEGQILTVSLADYGVPTSSEMPPLLLAHRETLNPNVPNGAKGGGESGCIGTPPAIANAVFDALGVTPQLPITLPVDAQMLWRAYGALAGTR